MASKKQPLPEADYLDPEGMNLNEIYGTNRHKYLMVCLLAGRAIDLKKGSRAQVELKQPHTNLELAVAEAHNGLLKIQRREIERRMVNLLDSDM